MERTGTATAVEGPVVGASRTRCVAWLDDEESLLFLAGHMLERLGFQVTSFLRGADAVAAILAEPSRFDLLVTDHNMPGMTGIDVTRAVRALDVRLPVLLLSGFVTPALEAEARLAGVDAVLEKPDSMRQLCHAVEQVIEGRERA